tara:strand:+ start:98 stop:535 length:438 start_codon:yes stop_codon:yes gene_type:complete
MNKTIERRIEVDNYANIPGLDSEGYRRNRIADTLATRVVFDADWGEYVVMVYLDGHRYEEADYHTDDKADAIGTAEAIRDKAEAQEDNCWDCGVNAEEESIDYGICIDCRHSICTDCQGDLLHTFLHRNGRWDDNARCGTSTRVL